MWMVRFGKSCAEAGKAAAIKAAATRQSRMNIFLFPPAAIVGARLMLSRGAAWTYERAVEAVTWEREGSEVASCSRQAAATAMAARD